MATWVTTETRTESVGYRYTASRPYGYQGVVYMDGVVTENNIGGGVLGEMHVMPNGSTLAYIVYADITGETQRAGGRFRVTWTREKLIAHIGDGMGNGLVDDTPGGPGLWQVFLFPNDGMNNYGFPKWSHVNGTGYLRPKTALVCDPVPESLHVYLNGVEQFVDTDYKLVVQGNDIVVDPLPAMDARANDLLECYYACASEVSPSYYGGWTNIAERGTITGATFMLAGGEISCTVLRSPEYGDMGEVSFQVRLTRHTAQPGYEHQIGDYQWWLETEGATRLATRQLTTDEKRLSAGESLYIQITGTATSATGGVARLRWFSGASTTYSLLGDWYLRLVA